MTGDQSRKLKVGSRVYWNGHRDDSGTITDTNWSGVVVKWDDRGQQPIMHNDMVAVSAA